jgi:hypothetical protein
MILFKAGVQLPVMPLFDVVGNGDKDAPAQISENGLKLGVILGLTEMVIVVMVAHCPPPGVKV